MISSRGVFVGHYWENIGFNPDKDLHGDLYPDQETAFQKYMLSLLKRGSSEHNDFNQLKRTIEDDYLLAYLMISDTGPSDDGIRRKDPYRDFWERIKTAVNGKFPILARFPDRWSEYIYHPVQNEDILYEPDENDNEMENPDHIVYDPLAREAHGKLLVKYHPDHHGRNKIMMWMEYNQMHDGEW